MRGAVLVGIDAYEGAWPRLGGCVADVTSMARLLGHHADEAKNFDVTTFASSEGRVLSDDVLDATGRLMQSEATAAWVHFSGHGVVDQDRGSCLVDQSGLLLPLSDVMRRLANAKVPQRILTLDCCFAGDVGASDLLASDVAVIPEGVVVLAAARGSEPAIELDGRGAFTSYLVSGLAGGAADVTGQVTAAGLHAYLDEAFGVMEQRPVLKANLTRLVPLRQCPPLVPVGVLRRLPDYFPDPDGVFALDPSYEDAHDGHDPANAAVFKELQKCANARLVVPVGLPAGESHMYWAAMRGTGCRLTLLGRRYRRLAQDGRL